MKRHTSSFICSLILCSSLLMHGCAGVLLAGGAAAGAGTYAYVNGELKTTVSEDIDQVWGATVRAVENLRFGVKEQSNDSLTGRMVASTAGDTDVYINLKSLSSTDTELRIRAGVFGDELISKRVHKEIMNELK